ncbi:hypothetical protein DFH05DRAFT_1598254 [Lentinula detonsa]|uniref:Uncharacterized protein n=1 Tax=Lentinula detonsa TaxID=2804962 RepID=A0A9W8U032_9AGAR|nr:hypothetical protein DFH05DRAFT_1598254 [Lentinula detonsa]
MSPSIRSILLFSCTALSTLWTIADAVPVSPVALGASIVSRGPGGKDPVAPWVVQDFRDVLTKEDKQVFGESEFGSRIDMKAHVREWDTMNVAQPLVGVKLGTMSKLPSLGANNDGLYRFSQTYINHAGETFEKDDVILKVLKSFGDEGFAEVKALKKVGEWVDSGSLAISGVSKPAIVMKARPGEALVLNAYYKDHPDKQMEMAKDAKMQGCKKAAKIATACNVFYWDVSPVSENVLVDVKDGAIASVELVSWGSSSIIFVQEGKEKPSEASFYDLCFKGTTRYEILRGRTGP